MADNVQINIDGKTLECPIIVGTEGDRAFDIGKLRAQTNYITMDPGFGNTGSCKSAITYLDEAIRLNPKSSNAINNRGIAYLHKNDNDRAIADYDQAIRLDPTYVNAFGNRGKNLSGGRIFSLKAICKHMSRKCCLFVIHGVILL